MGSPNTADACDSVVGITVVVDKGCKGERHTSSNDEAISKETRWTSKEDIGRKGRKPHSFSLPVYSVVK